LLYGFYSFRATSWRTQFVREMNEADSSSNTRAVDSLLNYETVKYFTNEEFEASATMPPSRPGSRPGGATACPCLP
jgi:ABC-type transport system involved in Fe-S cluster assembly fused permease/ATPase subunit